jgi:hypothetical protein
MIESVKRSRSRFYRDAALLLDRYRQLMNHELDSEEAKNILNNTLIAPDKAEVLFELYWVFQVLNSYSNVQYRVLTDAHHNPSTIATWEEANSKFVLSHDATGEDLTFSDSVDNAEITPDGYLYRMNEVLSKWQSLSEDILGRGGSDALWGGRPDLVLEQFEQTHDEEWRLSQVFLGEVKYTQHVDYVATGLRELLEYMAFVKRKTTGEYVESPSNILDSVSVKGALFVDELSQDTVSPDNEDIQIVQYPDSPDKVM